MRILFIHPSQKKVYHTIMKPAYPPLGILYMAACLEKEGHTLKFIDYDNDSMNENKFKDAVLDFKPELVGFTSTTPTFNHTKKLVDDIKKITDTKIVVGGIHATTAPEETLEVKNVDFIVIGEGEITICELAKELEKKNPNFSKIKGIGYKKNNKLFFTKPRPMIMDLDTLPFPARHLSKNEYVPFNSIITPTTSVFTSRGCNGACTYCCTKHIFGFKVRARSAKNVADEIELLTKQGYKDIHIMDDIFTFDKKRVLEVRDEMKKRGVKPSIVFGNGIRADQIDEEILQALKDMGVQSIGFGVESGNPEILKNVKKGIKMDTVRKAYKLVKSYGFETWGFFIIGLPGDTKETVRDTINFAKELDPDYAKFLILKPYPKSEVFEQLNKQNLIFDFNYDHYGPYTGPVHRLNDLTPEDMLKLQKKAFREFYLRPKKVFKRILRLRSPAQIKITAKATLFVLKKIFS